MKVEKKSGKPFKSGLKINTVKDIIDNPFIPGRKAYTFYEDDSCVNIEMCNEIK